MLRIFAAVCRPRNIQGHCMILKKQLSKKANKRTKKKDKDSDCKKAAVILAGCGYLDGSSVHETAAVAINLSKNDVLPLYFAPTNPQACVIDHYRGCPVSEKRCTLQESARLTIAGDQIRPLCELRTCDVSCLIVPGGFGVAQTLSTYQKEKECCTIDSEVLRVLEEFHDVKKPMGFMCISPILPAKLFPCVKVTFGMKGNTELWPYQEVIDVAADMGAEVESRKVDEFSFDKQYMVFSTPAFMYAGTHHEIFEGIGHMIENMCNYLD